MTKFLLVTVALTVLSVSAATADDAKVSFTFDVGLVKVSITGVSQEALHDEQTKKMLKRVAQLAHYSVRQLKWQKDFPECLEHGTPKDGGAAWSAPCLKWEK